MTPRPSVCVCVCVCVCQSRPFDVLRWRSRERRIRGLDINPKLENDYADSTILPCRQGDPRRPSQDLFEHSNDALIQDTPSIGGYGSIQNI